MLMVKERRLAARTPRMGDLVLQENGLAHFQPVATSRR